MKKCVPLIAVLLLLFQLAAGQPVLTLHIVNTNGNGTLSWTGWLGPLFYLQTTTNLSPPVTWTDIGEVSWTGSLQFPISGPQQFFRVVFVESGPVYQFAIFYNMNLEMSPAFPMTITGPVWSNGGIWTGSTTATFASTVSAVGIATNTANDPFCTGYTGSGPSIYLLAGQPTSGNGPLTMPLIGTNNDPAAVEALINLPPTNYAMGTAAAYSPTGSFYFANDADLFLTNFVSGTNWLGKTPVGTNMILYYQDGANNPYLTQLPYDFFIITNRGTGTVFFTNSVVPNSAGPPANNYTNVIYAGYSFVTNVLFYDWREGWNGGKGVNSGKGKAVQALQIDVKAFDYWLVNSNLNGTTNINGGRYYNNLCDQASHKGHPVDSIYIFNSVPLTSTTLPAVRVTDGGMLPVHTAQYGFTVATAMPLYVFGDYNVSNNLGSSINQNSTIYTWPAALMGDAITILSDSWKDSITYILPTASSSTSVNAACSSGIVQSTNSVYSGGVENFFRLLENWGTGTFYWNGSMVAMFTSRYATNSWQQTGNYYTAPTRKWAFDTNFTSLFKLPPLTPTLVNE